MKIIIKNAPPFQELLYYILKAYLYEDIVCPQTENESSFVINLKEYCKLKNLHSA